MTQDEIREMDKAQLLDKNTFLDIFDEESDIDREYLLLEVMERAEELKCKTQVNKIVRAFKSEIKEASRPDQNMQHTTHFGGDYSAELECGNWIADENGVRILTMFGEKMACYHPIMPIHFLPL